MSAVLNFKSHLSELFAQPLREVAPDTMQTEILIERPKLVVLARDEKSGQYSIRLPAAD